MIANYCGCYFIVGTDIGFGENKTLYNGNVRIQLTYFT